MGDPVKDALRQTGWQGAVPTAASWRRLVGARLDDLDWRALSKDVAPFLEPGADAALLTADNLRRLLKRKSA